MKSSKFARCLAISAATAGLLFPQTMYAGNTTRSPATQQQEEILADVALSKGGVITGQVVDAQNKGLADTAVVFRNARGEQFTTQTNNDGYFSVAGLKGGTYTATTEGSTGAFRLWAADTAPPSAISGVMLVPNSQQVLGQSRGLITRGGLVILGITGAIVATGVIIQNRDDDDSSS